MTDDKGLFKIEDKAVFNIECQKYCFTKWVDQRLRLVGETLTNLADDFAETDKLLTLAEVLSGRRVHRVVKKKPANMKNKGMYQMEKITMALNFWEKEERIRFETIDSSLLVKKNIKMVLGLTWTLIHHYAISMVMWDGAAPCPVTGDKKQTMLFRQRLLMWIQSKVPEINVRNFTSDWRDGRLLGALVDALGPGLCGDWKTWSKGNALQNTRRAMEAAQESLDISMLLQPEHVVDEKLEENSMMTYLSQFPIAELHPDVNLSTTPIPERVKVYGSGIQPTGVQVGAPARFTVETFSAGEGALKVTVQNSEGKEEKCDVVNNNDKNKTYSCVFVPSSTGKYKITITFAGQGIRNSPFTVAVEKAAADATKVTVDGAGIEGSDVVATKRTSFIVNCKGAGKGIVDVEIEEPSGRKDAVIAMVEPVPKESDKYKVEYGPLTHGPHRIGVFYGGNEIPKSPFTVNVKPFEPEIPIQKSVKPSTSTMPGDTQSTSGGSPQTARATHIVNFRPSNVGSECKIIRYIEGASLSDLRASFRSPSGGVSDCKVTSVGSNLYCFSFVPKQTGTHTINVKNKDTPVAGSPFEYTVGTVDGSKPDKMSVSSVEVTKAEVNKPAVFNVYTHEAGSGELLTELTGPMKGNIDIQERPDGSLGVSLKAAQPGKYMCIIKFNSQTIPNSPFTLRVAPSDGEFRKVSATSVQQTTFQKNSPVDYSFNLNGAHGKMKAYVISPAGEMKEVPVDTSKKGQATVHFQSKQEGVYYLELLCDEYHVPCSPRAFTVGTQEPLIEASTTVADEMPMHKTQAETRPDGRGFQTLKSKVTCTPSVKATECKIVRKIEGVNLSDLKASFSNRSGKMSECTVTSLGHELYSFNFVPEEEGLHAVRIQNKDMPVPGSPFQYTVGTVEGSKPNMVQVDSRELMKAEVNKAFEFNVYTHEAGSGELTVEMKGPGKGEIHAQDREDGSRGVTFTATEPGEYECSIKFNGQHIPNSPFTLRVAPPDGEFRKVSAVSLQQTGLQMNRSSHFSFKLNGAKGELKAFIVSPLGDKKEVHVAKSGNNQATIEFEPEQAGAYQLLVLCGGYHVPGSPFLLLVGTEEQLMTASKVTAQGEGLYRIKPGENTFVVYCVGETKIEVNTEGPEYLHFKPKLLDSGAQFSYKSPQTPGSYKISIKCNGVEITGSPFWLRVEGEEPATVSSSVALETTAASRHTKSSQESKRPNQVTMFQSSSSSPQASSQIKQTIYQSSSSSSSSNINQTMHHSFSSESSRSSTTHSSAGGFSVQSSAFAHGFASDNAMDIVDVGTGVDGGKCDVHKCVASGAALKEGVCGQINTFYVDASRAGFGMLLAGITGPTIDGDEIVVKFAQHNLFCIRYNVKQKGQYTIRLCWAGEDIAGSPFHVIVK